MAIYKGDNFNGYDTGSAVDVSLWMTEAAIVGDWVAVHVNDTTSPGAGQGESYRIADADEASATYDTVGFLVEACAAASFGRVRVKGRGPANVDSAAAVIIGDLLSIGATAGRAIESTGTNPALRVLGTVESTPASNLAIVHLAVHPRFADL